MPWSFSGSEFHEKLLDLQEKTNKVISDSKAILEPMLTAQGATLSDGDDLSSIITDINKLKTIEHHINNGDLEDMTFVEPGLFSRTVLPSNVVMFSKTRSVFIEEGLLYIIDFDIDTLKIVNQRIYKIDPLWELADGNTLRLVKGDIGIWAVPLQGNKIIGIYGDGLSGEGDIFYRNFTLWQDLEIHDFKEWNSCVAFISSENIYYRIDNIYELIDYGPESWLQYELLFNGSTICDGDIDYVASMNGEIYHLNLDTGEFKYVTDIKSEMDYENHMLDKKENPDDYLPILSLVKNGNRWSMIDKSNKLYTIESWTGNDFDEEFIIMELPVTLSQGTIIPNRSGSSERCIIFGFDDSYNAIALTFRTEFDSIEEISIGDDILPQLVSFAICDEGAVMIGLYEFTIKANDYFSEEEIDEYDLVDYNYTSMVMRMSAYTDYRYDFGPEFNPLFIPDQAASECNTTIITGKSAVSPLFNVAITDDHKHWDFVNISPDIAINVQDIASGDNTFVMAGLYSKYLLISNYGYDWERIQISDTEMSIISVAYNDFHNKFYALEYDGNRVVEFNPVDKSVRIIDIDIAGDVIEGEKIMSFRHNLVMNFRVDDERITYITNSLENENDPFSEGCSIKSNDIFMQNDEYAGIPAYVKDVFEVDDEVYVIYALEKQWDENGYSEYDRSLKTGLVMYYPKYFREITCQDANINNTVNQFVFPYDETQPITGMMYLNHIIIVHPQDKQYIASRGLSHAPMCYGGTRTGRYFGVVVNSKCGVTENGYIHLIQSHANKFTRIGYVMSSSQSYMPVVTNADLYHTKKAMQLQEYGMEESATEVDHNGNIDVYNITYSKLQDVSCGPIIYGDRFVKLGYSNIGYQSQDGINWTSFKMPNSGQWRDIAYANGIYVAVLYMTNVYSEIWYSSDLVNWKKSNVLDLPYGWTRVISVLNTFILFAHTDNNFNGFVSSQNGIDWQITETPYPVTQASIVLVDTISSDFLIAIAYAWNKNGKMGLISIANDRNSTEIEFQNMLEGEDFSLPINSSLFAGVVVPQSGTNFYMLYASGRIFSTDSIGNFIDAAQIAKNPRAIAFDNDYMSIVFIYSIGSSTAYISLSQINRNAEDPADYNQLLTKIELPEPMTNDGDHNICYHDNKLYVGLSRPVIIDLVDTYPDIVEGSFLIGSGETHREELSFTPDHVFLFGAKTYSKSSKFLLAEIHNEDDVVIDGSEMSSITFYNNTLSSIGYRSDVGNKIITNGFTFVNNTLSDRHINFIAIKENHYT